MKTCQMCGQRDPSGMCMADLPLWATRIGTVIVDRHLNAADCAAFRCKDVYMDRCHHGEKDCKHCSEKREKLALAIREKNATP